MEPRDKLGGFIQGSHHYPINEFKKGYIPWNKNTKGICKSNKTSFKPGIKSWSKGTKGILKPNSGSFKKGQFTLEKHPGWRGGISFEPYTKEFNKQLKQQIRERDNYTCQECNYTQKELSYALCIHHIDYNKLNNNPLNLISLCRSCHAKTNFGREDWANHFTNKIVEV